MPDQLLLTDAIAAAQGGLRSQVQHLIHRLPDAVLHLPLSSDLAWASEGELIELSEDFKLTPHLLSDEEGHFHCALFTQPELLEPFERRLGWRTGGGPLKYCTLNARLALQVAEQLIDERRIVDLLIDPGAPSELLLRRSELSSIISGRAIPLVGYVAELVAPHTLIAEPGDPPPPALVEALKASVAIESEICAYRLERTFNPERDLEPHWTLTLELRPTHLNRGELGHRIIERIQDQIPPPGYIDVFFETNG
ncbi:MAG TPA: SseB family protein [Polyangiaceae bacterium]|jgi:hypothetical protein